MVSYDGRHAELFDLFYADKPYQEEADFVHQCLQKYGSNTIHSLLEIACGTGTHALTLERYGYKIVATDYSESLLACARKKASQESSSVDFRWQDMRSLNIPEQPFDAVFCLFDSIGYVETNDALIQVMRGVHDHLRPNGLFIFEFWHAAAMLRSYDPLRIRRWSTPNGDVIRISETELDCVHQVARVTYTIYELQKDGTYLSVQETQTNRYFLMQEMASWLSICGFVPVKWFAGYNDDNKINQNTWHVLAIARREE